MKKIYIIGIVASGKTTLAKNISEKFNIPWYELDNIVYNKTNAGRFKRTDSEQAEVIMDIDQKGSWIFEGTDRKSYRYLYNMADIIIFLDTPLWKRRIRILTRFIKQNLGLEDCHYKPDLTMLKMMYKWTRDFEINRPVFESRLKQHKTKVIQITDNRKIDTILNKIIH